MAVNSNHVTNVDVGARLIAAEHRHLAVLESLHGEHVDADVQAHSRRVPAHCRRPDAMDLHGIRVAQQYTLSDHLGLVVGADRDQLQVLGDLRIVFDAIYTARARKNELLDAGFSTVRRGCGLR